MDPLRSKMQVCTHLTSNAKHDMQKILWLSTLVSISIYNTIVTWTMKTLRMDSSFLVSSLLLLLPTIEVHYTGVWIESINVRKNQKSMCKCVKRLTFAQESTRIRCLFSAGVSPPQTILKSVTSGTSRDFWKNDDEKNRFLFLYLRVEPKATFVD